MSLICLEGCLRKAWTLASLSSTKGRHLGTMKESLMTRAMGGKHCLKCLQQSSAACNVKSIRTYSKILLTSHCPIDTVGFHFMRSHRRHGSGCGQDFVQTKWQNESLHFVESENEYFHSYLESFPEYQPYLLSSLQKNEVSVLPPDTVDKLLREVKENKSVNNFLTLFDHWTGVAGTEGWQVLYDDSFSQTVRLLKKYANRLSAEEMIQCMAKMNNLGFRQSVLSYSEPRRNRILVSKTFDQLCSKRIKHLDVKELLLAADFFYSVRGTSFTEFPFLMCEKMTNFLPVMTKAELILLMYHAGMTRRASATLISAALDCLKGDMNSLTIEELAIVNMAHYKTRSHIRDPAYFAALTKQLKTSISQNADPICLAAVLKYQQKSLNKCKNLFLPQFFTTVRDLEDPLLLRISTLPAETLMHVLNLYYSLDLLSEELFMATIDRIVNKGLKDWRVKDLARVTHILTNVPLGSEKKMEALAAILVELRNSGRQGERQKFPECMLQVAVALTYCSVYPHWLVEEIFSDVSQRKFKDCEIDYRRDLYHLSESIVIEDGTYIGPLLWAENLPKLAKNNLYNKLLATTACRSLCGNYGMQLGRKKKLDDGGLFARDWLLLEVMEALVKARPEVTPVPTFLLSHFQTPDVEIKVASKEPNKEQIVCNPFVPVSVDEIGDAIVLHASNAYQNVRFPHGKTVPLLRQYHAMRARHLRKLGATVIEVAHFEFQESKDKSQYLLTKFQEEEKKQSGIN